LSIRSPLCFSTRDQLLHDLARRRDYASTFRQLAQNLQP
jgi:hypothetical protein